MLEVEKWLCPAVEGTRLTHTLVARTYAIFEERVCVWCGYTEDEIRAHEDAGKLAQPPTS